MVHQIRFDLSTQRNGDMHDLTSRVGEAVVRSGIRTGTVTIFVVGSTAAVGTIEFEPGLQRDLPEILNRLMPPSREDGPTTAAPSIRASSSRTFRIAPC